jgi:predicted MFS family arabinose efflux permease
MSGHVPGVGAAERAAHRAHGLAVRVAGGPARFRVVLILAAVLGLSGADTGTISSTTGNLEQAFHVGNTQIGVLLSIVGLVGALFTIPAGILTDRVRRTRLLGGAIVFWAAATLVSGFAMSYLWMLLARVGLGVVTAVTGPAIASLTGDYFPASDRGRMYGLILGGDLLGSGFGYVISGDLSSITTWRAAYWWLAVPSLALAWMVWRLPEPARGGLSHIAEGAEDIRDESEISPAERRAAAAEAEAEQEKEAVAPQPGMAGWAVQQAHVQPEEDLILHKDPTNTSMWWAAKYVLRLRTNLVIIIASGLGYFFFAGLRTFAILYATNHYGVSKPVATTLVLVVGAGALAGVFVGGRIADRLLARGHIRARVIVPTVCLLALTPVLAPGIATTSVAVALPLLTLGAFLLGAPNPPLDAARLDIVHPRLWGRAEGIRTLLRSLLESAAPTLFGFVSQYVFGGPGSSASSGGTHVNVTGLEYTFLIFLIPLIVAGLLSMIALRTYPRDVATALASVRAIRETEQHDAAAGRRRAALTQPSAG